MTGCWRQGRKQKAVAASLLSTGQTEMGQCCSQSNAWMQALGKSHGDVSALYCSCLRRGRESDPKSQNPQILTFKFES